MRDYQKETIDTYTKQATAFQKTRAAFFEKDNAQQLKDLSSCLLLEVWPTLEGDEISVKWKRIPFLGGKRTCVERTFSDESFRETIRMNFNRLGIPKFTFAISKFINLGFPCSEVEADLRDLLIQDLKSKGLSDKEIQDYILIVK